MIGLVCTARAFKKTNFLMYEIFELFGRGWESNRGVNFNHDVDFCFLP